MQPSAIDRFRILVRSLGATDEQASQLAHLAQRISHITTWTIESSCEEVRRAVAEIIAGGGSLDELAAMAPHVFLSNREQKLFRRIASVLGPFDEAEIRAASEWLSALAPLVHPTRDAKSEPDPLTWAFDGRQRHVQQRAEELPMLRHARENLSRRSQLAGRVHCARCEGQAGHDCPLCEGRGYFDD